MTDLYRHFDENGRLLYVGISLNAVARSAQHKGGSSWFGLVRKITIEKFATREEALVSESEAIKKETPLHNIQHSVSKETVEEIKEEYSFTPNSHVLKGLVGWVVKWRHFTGEICEREFDDEIEAEQYAGKLRKIIITETQIKEDIAVGNEKALQGWMVPNG